MPARCAVCLVDFRRGDPHPLYKDEYLVHPRCVDGTPHVARSLSTMKLERDGLKNQVEQANRSARAMIDRAHEIETRVFTENTAVHARVTELENALAAERSRAAMLEAQLELTNRLPRSRSPEPDTPDTEEISKPSEDDLVIRSGLLELD